jgi:hypothetical protein
MKKTFILATSFIIPAIFTVTAQDADKSKWQDMEIDFPKPMFVGTPVAAKLPNLDKSKKPRLVLKAPAGSENVALDMEVTSSDPEPIIGDLEMICDGDKDGADGSYTELGPGKQWVQVDLEEEADIYGVVVWHFHKNARAYIDVVAQLSNDPEFKTGVITVFNNDHDNSSKAGVGKDLAWIETNHGRIFDVKGKKARYVRLWSNGNTANEMNHYVEIEVYGKR